MSADQPSHPLKDLLAAYALGQLDEAASQAIEEHLAVCESCLSAVETSPADGFVNLVQVIGARKLARQEGYATTAVHCAAGKASTVADVEAPVGLADHPRYRIQGCIGRGGMGAVFKAEHLLMKRVVALKVINRSLIEKPAAVERFRREVEAAARLIHPNIVTAYDAEQVGNMHFLIMEHVEGKSLDKVLEESGGRLPVEKACEYIRQVSVGLQHAHDCGMVHRDIKPQNLILTAQGQVKILDFGLARFARETVPSEALIPASAGVDVLSQPAANTPVPSLTEAGTIMGSPDYLAPEQAHDPHSADIRADIYSLGCTLYHLIAGHPPFPQGTAMEKIKAHAEQDPIPLDKLGLNIHSHLSGFVAAMMAKNPAHRPETPQEVTQLMALTLEHKWTLGSATPSRLRSILRSLWTDVLGFLPLAILVIILSVASAFSELVRIVAGVLLIFWAALYVWSLLSRLWRNRVPAAPIIRSVELQQPRESVWQVIVDLPNYAAWRSELRNFHPWAEMNIPNKKIPEDMAMTWWREAFKDGYSRQFLHNPPQNRAPCHMTLTFVGLMEKMTWEFELASTPRGTRITIIEKCDPSIFYRMGTPKNPAQYIEWYLQSLASKFGESAEIANE